jgi:hypothetical protein
MVMIFGMALVPLISKKFPNSKVGLFIAPIVFIAVPLLKGTSPGGPKARKTLQLLKVTGSTN